MASPMEMVVAWVAIGLAASIAGWIWPLFRGVAGIVTNAFIAVAGSLALGLVGWAVGGWRAYSAPSFVFAALGAILALTLLHAVWAHVNERQAHR